MEVVWSDVTHFHSLVIIIRAIKLRETRRTERVARAGKSIQNLSTQNVGEDLGVDGDNIKKYFK